MATESVEVRSCDRCGKEPANTWVIVGPDGPRREIELCDHHGGPIANAYALARPIARNVSRRVHARRGKRPPDALDLVVDPEPIWR